MSTSRPYAKAEIIEKVRNLKEAGKLQEALDLLEEYVGDRREEKDLTISITMQKSAFNRYRNDHTNGLLSYDQYTSYLQKINYSIEMIMDRLPETGELMVVEVAVLDKLIWDDHLRKVKDVLANQMMVSSEYRAFALSHGIPVDTLTIENNAHTDWTTILNFIRNTYDKQGAIKVILGMLKERSELAPLNAELKELLIWP